MRTTLLYVLMTCALGAQEDHPNLTGTWQFDAAKSDTRARPSFSTLQISEKADRVEFKQIEKDGQKAANFSCGIGGKECSIRELDGPAKASFWYNGPMLVEMKTHGDHISKYRMKLTEGGNVLDVEMLSLVPPSDKAEHLVFTKQP